MFSNESWLTVSAPQGFVKRSGDRLDVPMADDSGVSQRLDLSPHSCRRAGFIRTGTDILGIISGQWHGGERQIRPTVPQSPQPQPQAGRTQLALPGAQAPPPPGLVRSILSLWSEHFVFQQAAWPVPSLGVAVTLSGAQGPEPMATEALGPAGSRPKPPSSRPHASPAWCLPGVASGHLPGILTPLLPLDS